MPRGPGRPYPSVGLQDALEIPYGLRDHNAGHPMNRILLAEALGTQPASSAFRDGITAANKYGLITGNFNSETIELTPLGQKVASPASEEERLNALRQAMEQVALFKQLLEHYNNNRLPPPELLKSILERPPFSVAPAWSKEAAEVFTATGRLTGVIRDVGPNPYVIREAGPPVAGGQDQSAQQARDAAAENVAGVQLVAPAAPAAPITAPGPPAVTPPIHQEPTPATATANRQFFIAHGRDRTALAQLQSIMKELDIPYLVAEEEANVGRPISQKIADLMQACSAGIFIFSGDEEVKDPKGDIVKRPRPNVVYELGAASLLYGQRIVIFKEQGVEFPTDFRDLGYIEYERDSLSAKMMELLRELIKLRAVRLTPGA